MLLSEWREFRSLPCIAGKKTWWQLASRCCWNRARPCHASKLVSFLVWLRTYQHPGTQNRLSHCAVCLHRSVLRLICSSFYTHHVILAFGKTLWRCQTYSLKSKGYQKLFPSINKCRTLYTDISAYVETFRLCVSVLVFSVARAGNNLASTVSRLFHKNTASPHIT